MAERVKTGGNKEFVWKEENLERIRTEDTPMRKAFREALEEHHSKPRKERKPKRVHKTRKHKRRHPKPKRARKTRPRKHYIKEERIRELTRKRIKDQIGFQDVEKMKFTVEEKPFNFSKTLQTLLIFGLLLFVIYQVAIHKDQLIAELPEFDFSEIQESAKASIEEMKEGISEVVEDVKPEPRDVGQIEAKIHSLVNQERARNGRGALRRSSSLDKFARSWSNKMISQNFIKHSNLNFHYSSQAAENIGETPIHYSVVGCGSTYDNDAIAECFVSGWISSSGHHANMLGSFSNTGIGVACDSSKCRATQVFSG